MKLEILLPSKMNFALYLVIPFSAMFIFSQFKIKTSSIARCGDLSPNRRFLRATWRQKISKNRLRFLRENWRFLTLLKSGNFPAIFAILGTILAILAHFKSQIF